MPTSFLQSAGDRRILAFPLLVWAIMLIADIKLVSTYGSNVPSWDDWDFVPTITGHQPITMQWLWSQHNEHRLLIPRMALLALIRFVATDFRVGMYFNVLTTAALALALIIALFHIRGRASVFDAFIPIALMNWSQAANFLWCSQVAFYASMLLSGIILVVIGFATTPPKFGPALLAAVCIMLLPLCGANGLGLVPPFILWLSYTGLLYWRTNTAIGRRNGIVLGAIAVITVLLVAFYFVGYTTVPYHPSTHRLRIITQTAAQFLTMGFGPGIVGLSSATRTPMPFWGLACFGVVGLYFLTAWLLLATWRKEPEERARAAGLLLFLAAMVSLALGLGMGRDGFETRYITLSVPGLCAVYVAWSIYGTSRLEAHVKTLVFVTVLITFAPNTYWGWYYAHELKSRLTAFEAQMAAGSPPFQLVRSYSSILHPHHTLLTDYMPMLREAGVGNFQHLRDNPPFRKVNVPLEPMKADNTTAEYTSPWTTSTSGWLTFELASDVDAAGICLHYSCAPEQSASPYLSVYWKSSDQLRFTEEFHSKYSPTGDRDNWQRGAWSRLPRT
ncbi:hypothetical protein BH18ACI4_BH18ACI4_28960 [soil metagenome]